VLAHPDDESMGAGGLIVRHTRNNMLVRLVCATRGEQGWGGRPPGARKEDLAKIRTAELEAASKALAIVEVELWDYPDGGVDGTDRAEISDRIGQVIRDFGPAAVITWGPDGGYGHPDHIAIGACTDAAVAAIGEDDRPALYHLAIDEQLAGSYRELINLVPTDGEAMPLAVADHVDVIFELSPDEVKMKLRAIYCHESQLQDWMMEVQKHPDLLQRGWGHEPYIAVPSRNTALTAAGLLEEFE